MKKYRLLEANATGWARVWQELEQKFGSRVCYDLDTKEVWQYMGSWVEGITVVHQFRHRSLNGKRVYYDIVGDLKDFESC